MPTPTVLTNPTQAAAWMRQRCPSGRLVADSRAVRAGDAFLAWPGAAHDARRFVPHALAAGARACLVSGAGWAEFCRSASADWHSHESLAVYESEQGLKAEGSPIADAFYGQPSKALDLIAFTGTNGKTSSAWWTAQLLAALGEPSGMVGTLGIGMLGAGMPHALHYTGLTTPDPATLHGGLHDMVQSGAKACVIEASSIGLAEHRLDATSIKTAAYTNFTQDHLDYHNTMKAYWAAKRALFDWLGLRIAVVNIDDAHGTALAAELKAQGRVRVWTVSAQINANSAADIQLIGRGYEHTAQGVQLTFEWQDLAESATVHRAQCQLVGGYNLSNLVGVIAAVRAQGFSSSAIAAAVCQGALSPVPGRMQIVPQLAGCPQVVVDYAHTPDALTQALRTLRGMQAAFSQSRANGAEPSRLWCVFGCGGNRDASKRPLMAAAALAADAVVITSDNPRDEAPQAIVDHMLAGIPATDLAVQGKVRVVLDRAAAIEYALHHAAPHDVVLIAGKGHEDYQEVAGVKHPFSDVAVAQQAMTRRAVDKSEVSE